MDIDSYQTTVKLSESSVFIEPPFGIHPWEAPKYATSLAKLRTYLKSSPLIGEIGLDYYFVKNKRHYPLQRIVFDYRCDWASRLRKIVNLHTKGAEREVLETLVRKKSIAQSCTGILVQ